MKRWLILGDILAIAIVTIIGFATHGEVGLSYVPRMLTTFLPLLAGWFITSPWLGLFETEASLRPDQLWRSVLAAILSAPLAATLRGFMLGTSILPIFVLVLAGSFALGMLAWRALALWLARRHRL